jgi:F0F1-type ATP synthase membrane subunit c/vacuolar-type H+-ATPase subunit K
LFLMIMAAKLVGAGLATIALAIAAIGVGLIFAALITAFAQLAELTMISQRARPDVTA